MYGTILFIAIALTFFFVLSVYIMGKIEKDNTPKVEVVRKGYIEKEFYHSCSQTNNEQKDYTATIVVKEIDKVADKSKIEILHIEDDLNCNCLSKEKYIRKVIGQYYTTSKIKWDKSPSPSKSPVVLSEEDKIEKVIKTPLSELVKNIEQEDISNV